MYQRQGNDLQSVKATYGTCQSPTWGPILITLTNMCVTPLPAHSLLLHWHLALAFCPFYHSWRLLVSPRNHDKSHWHLYCLANHYHYGLHSAAAFEKSGQVYFDERATGDRDYHKVAMLGTSDIDERLEVRLVDGIIYSFMWNPTPIVSTILWQLNNKSAKVHQQAANLTSSACSVLHGYR